MIETADGLAEYLSNRSCTYLLRNRQRRGCEPGAQSGRVSFKHVFEHVYFLPEAVEMLLLAVCAAAVRAAPQITRPFARSSISGVLGEYVSVRKIFNKEMGAFIHELLPTFVVITLAGRRDREAHAINGISWSA